MSGEPSPAAALSGVDRADFAVAFADRLLAAGMAVGLTGVRDFTEALAANPPRHRGELYWTARVTLVRRHRELATFDAVFAAVFATAPTPTRRPAAAPSARPGDRLSSVPRGRDDDVRDGAGLPWTTLPPAVDATDAPPGTLLVPRRLPSDVDEVAGRPFEALDATQVALLAEWLRRAAPRWPRRRTRRRRVGPAGRWPALRPTIARSRRTGWEPVQLVSSRPVRRARRVVMLCDVSQSMQAQAAAYLHLMLALARVADAEVFAFATRLTRLTAVLRHTAPVDAVAQASAAVTDRFGGTRIATALATLLSSHHGEAVRGAVVIIGSDGWDSDPPAELAAAMARLARRAHRIIWINPRAGQPGFAPRVAAMAAAVPYCDALLPADTFASLAAVIAEICADPAATGRFSSRSTHAPTGGTGPR